MVLNSWWIALDGDQVPLSSPLYSTFGEILWSVIDSEVIPNHVERAKSLLIEQFKRPPLINKLVEAFVKQVQELEYVFVDLLAHRSINTAYGDQLDGIGDIVGQPRNGMIDSEYRDYIIFRIFINTSNGEPETLIRALKFITKAYDVRYFQLPNATLAMFTNGINTPSDIVNLLEQISPAGVDIDNVSTSKGATPFSWSDDDGSVPSTGGGWNELGYAPGGEEVGGSISEGNF